MKNCLIAGGGSGIGRAILSDVVRSKKDWSVFGLSRRGVEYSEILVSGNNYRCDLTVESDIQNWIRVFSHREEKIHSVYVTIGDGLFKPISEISSEEWDFHFTKNLKSAFLLSKYIFPFLAEGAFVCFLSSTAGKMGFPNSSAYCASKHAIAGFAKALREEWKPNRIRVFTVYPGAVYTEIWKERPEFSKEDMMDLEEFSRVLTSFLDIHNSINLEETYLLPHKGIL
jgi:NAD(P)-dependent dehydrogenase (short-subunit alcohol dehydrogenase family)